MSLVSLADAATRLNLSSSTLRHQIRNKRFKARKIGRDWVTTDAEIARYRREHKMDEEIAIKHRGRSRKSSPTAVATKAKSKPKPEVSEVL
jgi:hypothetical protein